MSSNGSPFGSAQSSGTALLRARHAADRARPAHRWQLAAEGHERRVPRGCDVHIRAVGADRQPLGDVQAGGLVARAASRQRVVLDATERAELAVRPAVEAHHRRVVLRGGVHRRAVGTDRHRLDARQARGLIARAALGLPDVLDAAHGPQRSVRSAREMHDRPLAGGDVDRPAVGADRHRVGAVHRGGLVAGAAGRRLRVLDAARRRQRPIGRAVEAHDRLGLL